MFVCSGLVKMLIAAELLLMIVTNDISAIVLNNYCPSVSIKSQLDMMASTIVMNFGVTAYLKYVRASSPKA